MGMGEGVGRCGRSSFQAAWRSFLSLHDAWTIFHMILGAQLSQSVDFTANKEGYVNLINFQHITVLMHKQD